MTFSDFDIDSLAAYLHLSSAQVIRLADRGKLPGRKVQGQWRFAAAEIHHWLEDRIGLSDEGELAQVENVVSAGSESVISISAMLPIGAIAAPLAARTRSSVISAMAELAASTGLLWDAAKMAEAVQSRENLHPTALDNGVALLHPRRPLPGILGESFLALGITQQGAPFGGAGLTDIFFLLCMTSEREHLRVLARLSRLIGDASLLADLRAASGAHEAHEAIVRTEQRLFERKSDGDSQ
jgi:PTS system nitrogen regulatory IIA component